MMLALSRPAPAKSQEVNELRAITSLALHVLRRDSSRDGLSKERIYRQILGEYMDNMAFLEFGQDPAAVGLPAPATESADVL
jgi:hypothetical protein